MHRNNGEQLPDRPFTAHVDRHAISLTGHFLTAGMWLERRLTSVPRRGFRWVVIPERRALSTLIVRAIEASVDPTRNEEP